MKLKVVVLDLELSSRAKRWLIRLGVPAVVIGFGAMAYAGSPSLHTWSTNETLTASDLNDSFASLQAQIDALSQGTPGAIFPFAGDTCPTGSIPADGASLLDASYGRLFAAIGTTWGSSDGHHFNVPNLVNRYVRGAGTPTDGKGGVAVALGEYQEGATHVYTALTTSAVGDHTHGVPIISPNGELGGVNGGPNPGGFHTVGDNGSTASSPSGGHSHTVASGEGDTETRPKSYGALYCIYY
jgi:hypothetical protein